MSGYLTSAQVNNQATAFAIFARRRGGPIDEAWAAWAPTKSFQPKDAERIRQHAHELLFALGHTTEPPPLAA